MAMAERSGQTVVANAGTEVALGTGEVFGPLMVKALPGNTGIMYIGNQAGAVTSTSGMPLSAGEVIIFDWVDSLAQILVDGTVNGEGVAWLRL